MTEERLEALAMLHTHHELYISTSIEDVITRVAETGTRRLNFHI